MSVFDKRQLSPFQAPEEWRYKNKLYIRGDLAGIDGTQFQSSWWTYGTQYAVVGQRGVIAGWVCGQDDCDRRFVVIVRQSPHLAQRHLKEYHKWKKARIETSLTSNNSQLVTKNSDI